MQQRPKPLGGDLEQQARVASSSALACQTRRDARTAHTEAQQEQPQQLEVQVDSGAQSRVAERSTGYLSSSADRTLNQGSSAVEVTTEQQKSPEEDLVHKLALISSDKRTCLAAATSISSKKRHSLPEELRWRIFPSSSTCAPETDADFASASADVSTIQVEEETTTNCKTPTDPNSTPTSLNRRDLSDNKPDNPSSSTTTYKTAPGCSSSASNPDDLFITPPVSRDTSTSVYESARSHISNDQQHQQHRPLQHSTASSSSTLNGAETDMVSFFAPSDERSATQHHSASRLSFSSQDTGTPTITPNTEELEDMSSAVLQPADYQQEMMVDENDDQLPDELIKSSPTPGGSMMAAPTAPQAMGAAKLVAPLDTSALPEELDEEQIKRLLTYKRLSEGCCSRLGGNNFARKNSLHMMIEELPPLTEGEPMKHMSLHMSQNIESCSAASSGSSGSLRTTSCISRQNLMRELALKRGSQDENTSCSSSTSLERSPTHRRRSSTVSQCSSVLSEGTRNQLNFDLSPDLAPDSSLLEANAISPTDLDRPASPEPSSLSGDAFELRPGSCISPLVDELMSVTSPDSTLGDSNDIDLAVALSEDARFLERSAALILPYSSSTSTSAAAVGPTIAAPSQVVTQSAAKIGPIGNKQVTGASSSVAMQQQHSSEIAHQTSAAVSDEVEQLISDVSTVLVSGGGVTPAGVASNTHNNKRPATDDSSSGSSDQTPGTSIGKKPAKSSCKQTTTNAAAEITNIRTGSSHPSCGSIASQSLLTQSTTNSDDSFNPRALPQSTSTAINSSYSSNFTTTTLSNQDTSSVKSRPESRAGREPQ